MHSSFMIMNFMGSLPGYVHAYVKIYLYGYTATDATTMTYRLARETKYVGVN